MIQCHHSQGSGSMKKHIGPNPILFRRASREISDLILPIFVPSVGFIETFIPLHRGQPLLKTMRQKKFIVMLWLHFKFFDIWNPLIGSYLTWGEKLPNARSILTKGSFVRDLEKVRANFTTYATNAFSSCSH